MSQDTSTLTNLIQSLNICDLYSKSFSENFINNVVKFDNDFKYKYEYLLEYNRQNLYSELNLSLYMNQMTKFLNYKKYSYQPHELFYIFRLVRKRLTAIMNNIENDDTISTIINLIESYVLLIVSSYREFTRIFDDRCKFIIFPINAKIKYNLFCKRIVEFQGNMNANIIVLKLLNNLDFNKLLTANENLITFEKDLNSYLKDIFDVDFINLIKLKLLTKILNMKLSISYDNKRFYKNLKYIFRPINYEYSYCYMTTLNVLLNNLK